MRQILQNAITIVPQLNHDERIQLTKVLSSIADIKKVCDVVETIQDTNPHCPHCGSTKIYKHGIRSYLQRYRCGSCKRTFNSLTKTPLARLRKKEQWLSYLDCMLNSFTIRQSASITKTNKKTAFLWRHRFTKWLSKDKPSELSGIIEADETYYKYSFKGRKHLPKESHKRGNDKAIKGLSKRQVCVFTACDRSNQDIEIIAGLGSVPKSWLKTHFIPIIAKDAVLVTDGHKSYDFIKKDKNIEHIVVKDEKGKRVLGSYHIQHINGYHHRLRDWINHKFHGVATKYLTHYLSWRHELEKKTMTPISILALAVGINPPLTGT